MFPDLSGWEATKETLHKYSAVVGVVPRAHAESHPKWWHISLKVSPDGLSTGSMHLPDGGSFALRMDLRKHAVVLTTNGDIAQEFSMTEGLSSSAFGDKVLAALADLGLKGEYAREKFENDDPREYDTAFAEKYFTAVSSADRVFKSHREKLDGEMGPVQLWPHGFDLAFEWFGTRVVEHEEKGEVHTYPSQLNLGFSPGEPSHPKPYFFSNPWPFESEQLLSHDLPSGARWFTDGWQGSILPYAKLVGDDNAEEKLAAFAKAVHDITSPTLTA